MTTHKLFTSLLHKAFYILVLLAAISCGGNSDRQGHKLNANVLLYWPTDESDPVFKEWTALAKKELHRQGFRGDVEVHFAHSSERYESYERPLLNELILQLRAEGRMPDLILSYGDANRWLMITDVNSVTASIPLVCFGLRFEEYLPYQYELLKDNYEGGRWTNKIDIFGKLQLKKNLDLADSLNQKAIPYLQKPEYLNMCHNRMVTLLDVETLWTDRIVYNDLCSQMASLDPARYYNNLVAKGNEDKLKSVALIENKIIFSCRSIMTPSWNLSPEANQSPTTWVFYPQKSTNFFLQSKHDNKSRSLVEGPSFMPYYTMVPEDFLINKNCIGGYFCPAQEQIKDAVAAGKRLLEGGNAENIGPLKHKARYNINWDVIRPFGLDVNKIGEEISLYNVTFKDRKPKLYHTLMWVLWLIFGCFMTSGIITILYYARKNRQTNKKLHQYASETLSNKDIMEQVMEISDFKTWKRVGNDPDAFKQISTSDFFTHKIQQFSQISKAGHYTLQFYGSLNNQTSHWYEIRMTVRLNSEGIPERSGVIINNDKQKELEAIAAETNRIITSVKTREGFISSMNHEIRTPLNSIVGYTQLLAMPDIPIDKAEFEEYASAIEINSFLLQNSINNILTVNNLSQDKISPKIERLLLSDILCPESRAIPANGRIGKHKIIIENGPANLGVLADKQLLFEVIEKLLSNAALFSDETSDITLAWDKAKEEKYTAEISVKDRGIGIEPQYRSLIFERFFKIDSFSSGCGLGLYICKTYIELMGGRILVESTPHKGSIFKILLK